MLQTRCYNKLFKVHIKIIVLESVFDKDLDHLFRPTNLVIIFWQIAVFQYKFYSPQVKRGKISSALVTCLGNRLSLRVSSQFAAKPKTKEIRKYQKNLKIEWEYSLLAIFPSINDSLAKAIKITQKHIKVFFSYFALMRCRFETLLKRNSSASAFLWVSQKHSGVFSKTSGGVLWNIRRLSLKHLKVFSETSGGVL